MFTSLFTKSYLYILLFIISTTTADDIYLTIGFCPSYFSGKGAVVKVSPKDGSYSIQGIYSLPGFMGDSCPVLYDPNMLVNRDTQDTYLSFGDEWGMLGTINAVKAKMTSVKASCTDEWLFDGFTNFGIGAK